MKTIKVLLIILLTLIMNLAFCLNVQAAGNSGNPVTLMMMGRPKYTRRNIYTRRYKWKIYS